jgi:hypothetical protein
MVPGAAATVDIVRTAGLLKAEVKALRKVLEYARVRASSAMSAVKVLVLRYELVGCGSLGVSGIRKEVNV